MKLRPFFSFYGGKWRAAPHYPVPKYATIIEPFAGSAGYSLRHHKRNVVLIEKDPLIAETWRYLLKVEQSEILALPDIEIGQTTDDLNVSPGAKLLIGWWLNSGSAQPKKSPGAWLRSGQTWTTGGGVFPWGPKVRERVASQLDAIRHWTIVEGDYADVPDFEVTWFIDPPYVEKGRHYRFGSSKIDYDHLSSWCGSRSGQIIVCENDGADWLPFSFFRDTKSSRGHSREVVWYG